MSIAGLTLVDRQRELALLRQLLDDPANRLITVTGPFGVGKSRIVHEIVTGPRVRFGDRVIVLDLESTLDPDDAIDQVREAIRTAVSAIVDPAAADRLLILDNVDLAKAAAPTLSGILAADPMLTILATCRSPLNLRSERLLQIDPFPLGATDCEGVLPYAVSPALRLFEQHARASDPTFCLDDHLPAVRRICTHLDGVSLAIELGAARIRLLPPAALAQLIDESPDEVLDLLTGGPLDAPERHRSITAAIDWSARLLPGPARRLLDGLAAGTASLSLAAARSLAARLGLTPAELTTALDALAGGHLISVLPAGAPAPGSLGAVPAALLSQRIRLSPLVAAYGRRGAAESGNLSEYQQAQAEATCDLVEQIAPRLTSPHHEGWTRWLRAERAAINDALAWTLSEQGDPALALRLAAAVWRAWSYSTAFGEGIAWLRRVLTLAAPDPAPEWWDRVRAQVLLGCGQLCWQHGEHAEARDHLHECIRIAEGVADTRTAAFAVLDLGHVGFNDGHVGESLPLDEAVAVFRNSGDRWALALALVPLAYASISRGNLTAAQKALDESRRLFLATGDSWGIAVAALCQSRLAIQQGDFSLAEQRATESLAVFLTGIDRWRLAATHSVLGQIAQYLGDFPGAKRHFEDGIAISREVRHPGGTARLLRSLAGLARQQNDIETARALYAEALTESERLGDGWGASLAERALGAIEQQLLSGDPASTDQDGTVAAELAGSPAFGIRTRQDPPVALTRREAAVLRLLAVGKSNRDIGEQLVIGETTVASHVANIFAKIQATNRVEAAIYAWQHGLGPVSN